jgi:predicted Zn-dependent protease
VKAKALATIGSLAALGAGLPPVYAIAQQAPAARAAYEEGQALTAQKRFAEAVERFRRATAAEPDFALGWFGLAFAARRANDCPQAIPAYRKYAELRPTDAEPYYGLGLCLRDGGDRPAAVAALRRFIELEHRPTQARFIENARAAVALIEAPARDPRAPSPAADLYAEAQRLRDGGQIETALKKFAEAAAVDPDLMLARAAWGELLIKIRRDPEAIIVFRAALARNPQYPLIWYELAFTLRETGQLADAIDAYRRYILLRPNDPDPYYGLARTLARLGHGDEALGAYRTYVSMEKRPTEGRWVAAAQTEIAGLKTPPTGSAAPTVPITPPGPPAAPASP